MYSHRFRVHGVSIWGHDSTEPSERPVACVGVNGNQSSRSWDFAKRPFWVFSHIFALTVVVAFISLGFWQLNRLGQREDSNLVVEERAFGSPLVVETKPSNVDLDYRRAAVSGQMVDDDAFRVANRSQNGAAGEHVVGLIELADGSTIAVNRGFVPSNFDVELTPTEAETKTYDGWLRSSVAQEGFGVTDSGTGVLLPRLDTERISFRLGYDIAPLWLQLDGGDEFEFGNFPEPVPLPPLNEGSHRSYMAQWWVFAFLGSGFYLALLWRRSKENVITLT